MIPEVTVTTKEVIETVTERSFNIANFSVVFSESSKNGINTKRIRVTHTATDVAYWPILVKTTELDTVKHIGVNSLGSPFNSVDYESEKIKKAETDARDLRKRNDDEQDNYQTLFQCLTGENNDYVVMFINSGDHTMFVASESKFYRSTYFDYIEAQMNNANFNLDSVFNELKNSTDANLLLVSERVESIPSYNQSEGNNKCLQFFYSSEIPEPTTEKADRNNRFVSVYKKLGLLRFVKKNSSIAKQL